MCMALNKVDPGFLRGKVNKSLTISQKKDQINSIKTCT